MRPASFSHVLIPVDCPDSAPCRTSPARSATTKVAESSASAKATVAPAHPATRSGSGQTETASPRDGQQEEYPANSEDQQKNHSQHERQSRKASGLRLELDVWLGRERHMTFGADDAGDLTGEVEHGAIVVTLVEHRLDLPAKFNHLSVRDNRLESLADGDAVRSLIDGQQDQRTAILRLVADGPAVVHRVRKLLDGRAAGRVYGDDYQLGVRPIIQFDRQVTQLHACFVSEGVGKVVDIAQRGEIVEPLGADPGQRTKQRRKEGEEHKER